MSDPSRPPPPPGAGSPGAAPTEPSATAGSVETAVQLVLAWFHLQHTAGLYTVDNRAMIRPIEDFVKVSHHLVSNLGPLQLEARDDALLLNGTEVPPTPDTTAALGALLALFDRFGIARLDIEHPLSSGAVRRLLEILVYRPDPEGDFVRLRKALVEAELPLRLWPARQAMAPTDDDGASPVETALRTQATLVALCQDLFQQQDQSELRRQVARRISRKVQRLVDLAFEDRRAVLVASTVRGGAYLPRHSANVAALVIALGHHLGLSRVDLADFGLAGLLHDVGMSRVDASILDKPGSLDAGERAAVDRHTLSSVERLLEVASLTLTELRQIVVAFEHHQQLAEESVSPGGPIVLSRIVAVADAYDALTTDRPWRRALSPPEALQLLISEAGRRFDPTVVKSLARLLGSYPIGTLLRLSDGGLAMALGETSSPDQGQDLRIASLLGPDGQPQATVDLSQRDASGGMVRRVAAIEDPGQHGINVSGVVVASLLP